MKYWGILLIFISQSSGAASLDDGVRIVAAAERPFTFINGDKQLDGFSVALAKGILTKLHQQKNVEAYPWARLYKMALSQPNIVVLTMARTPQRESRFYWITSIARSIHGIYALRNSHVHIDSLAGLQDYGAVGVLRDDIREHWLRQAGVTNIVNFNSWEQVMSALIKGRVKTVFYSSSGVHYACRSAHFDCDNIENVFIYKVVTSYIAMSKQGTDRELVAKWRRAADAFKHDKAYVYLAHQWIDYYHQHEGMNLYLDGGAIDIWKDPNMNNSPVMDHPQKKRH